MAIRAHKKPMIFTPTLQKMQQASSPTFNVNKVDEFQDDNIKIVK